MQATLKYESDNIAQTTPGADKEPGTVLQLTDGRAAVVPGPDKLYANQPGIVQVVGIYLMATASATVFAEGDEVGWDESAELCVLATAAASDYSIGKARLGGSADGSTEVHVALNAHRYDARDADGHLVGLTLKVNDIPTADPSDAGQVWSDSGVLTVSAG